MSFNFEKLKLNAQIISGQSPSSQDCNTNGVGIPFLQGCAEFGDLFPTPKQHCTAVKKISRSNDILMSVRAPVGAINRSNIEYGIGRGLCAIRSRENANSRFLEYAIFSQIPALKTLATGSTFEAVSKSDIENLPIPIAPLPNQIAIANFLDRETAKIDELIANLERLIALLKEKRQAVISHAVTKGLNPNANMKDSGIDWIGEIPEHWEVVPIKRVALVTGGSTPPSEDQDCWDGEISWITPADLPNDRVTFITSGKRNITSKGVSSCSTRITPPNSVIVSSRAPIGSVAVTKDETCTNQGCKTLVPSLRLSALYLANLLLSARQHLISIGKGTTFTEVSGGAFGAIRIPLPPIGDQIAIADAVSREIASLDETSSHTSVLISLLRERRSAVISAAVTGQLHIPEEAGEAA